MSITPGDPSIAFIKAAQAQSAHIELRENATTQQEKPYVHKRFDAPQQPLKHKRVIDVIRYHNAR